MNVKKIFMKQNILKIGILFFGFAFLTSNGVLAQERSQNRQKRKPPTFKELLKKMDANKDGKLSKKEIKGPLKDDFDRVDLNEDGFITEKEFAKAPKPERKKRSRDNN